MFMVVVLAILAWEEEASKLHSFSNPSSCAFLCCISSQPLSSLYTSPPTLHVSSPPFPPPNLTFPTPFSSLTLLLMGNTSMLFLLFILLVLLLFFSLVRIHHLFFFFLIDFFFSFLFIIFIIFFVVC